MVDNDETEDVDSFVNGIKSGAVAFDKYDKIMKQILLSEGEKYKLTGKTNRALNDALRYQHKLTLAQKSADLVTEHLKMRDAMKKSTDTLSLFTGYLASPVSPMTIFKKMGKKIDDSITMFDRLKKVQKDLIDIEAKHGKNPTDPIARNQKTKLLKEEAQLKDKGAGTEENKGLMDKLSGAKEFFQRHKMGILIGGASAGILLAVLKKAFDVSPMFQAIKKLLNFGFMLILRPIGDFFGFIMRPIMVMMLRKFIIPWYRDVYPVMKKWGTKIGNAATTAFDISDAITEATGVGLGGQMAGAAVGGGLLLSQAGKIVKVATTAATKAMSPIIAPIAKIFGKGGTAAAKPILGGVVRTGGGALPKGAQAVAQGGTKAATNTMANASKIVKNAGIQAKNAVAGAQAALKGSAHVLQKAGQSAGVKAAVSLGSKIAAKAAIKAIPIFGTALAITDLAISPETLGGLIDPESDWRLDKLLNKATGGFIGLSEDSSGNFKTAGLGQFLQGTGLEGGLVSAVIDPVFDALGNAQGTGIGGGAGDARARSGVTVIINGNVSKEVDVEHIGQVVSHELAKDNKKGNRVF